MVQPLQNIHQGKKEAFIVKIGGEGSLNTAPVITSTPITEAAENLPYQYQVTAGDADGDILSYTFNNAPAGMQIDIHSGLIDWLPTQGGNAIVEIQVDDDQGGQTTQQFEIQIAKNHIPIFSSTPAITASKGKLYQTTLQATDSDNDSLNYQLLVYPPGMTIQTETGLIEWIPKAVGDYSVVVTVSDSRGASEKLAYSINVSSGSTITEPPPLNPTEFTSLAAATAFLYSGNDPVQTGVTEGTIEEKRVAILRGKVLNNDNQPLTGVTIKIKDHPEFGQTLSRADGIFDMAVNGGGLLTINYSKAGYLPVQRKVQTPWAEYAYAEDIIMIPLDEQATVIDLNNNSEAFQVAQGSVSTDVDGSRQATVLFPQGTTATMTLADGSTQALTSLTVRATEYTVGENGSKRMPGPLPPASGYTYAVELSVDEAIAADADKVTFNQKVPFYVDNFLDFPVGEVVPVGYYDKNKAVWIPSPNGKVIKVVSITDGVANLDVTGDGVVDTGITLTDLGITQEEQIQLASLYSAGKSLWRVQIEHLTPWDCNWPFAPPNDAVPPLPEPEDTTPPDEDQDDCQGCSIQPQSQSLGEKLPIIGTPFEVHYQSKRMKGYTLSRSIDIPLTEADIPTSLQSIKLTIHAAGQHFIQTFLPEPNLSHRFIWDGKDAYGRALDQAQATVIIDYQYPLIYYSAPSGIERAFAQATDKGSAGVIGKRGSQTVNIRRQWKRAVGGAPLLLDQASLGLWSLNIHHSYDRSTGILFQGDGMMRSGIDITKVISTLAGDGTNGFSGDGGPAIAGRLNYPEGITMGLDGSLYIADFYNSRIRKVGSDGIISTVAGNGDKSYSGDGGPATAAGLDLPTSVTMGPNGSIYIASDSNRIRRVANDLASIQDNEFVIPSSNAGQLFYFSLTGHHLRTQDTLTGKVIYLFSYNSDGQLVEIEDIDGEITIIKRDTEGNPLAIVAPDGQRTGLTLDLNGYLGMLTDPAGQSWEMEYKFDGLMSAFTDRNNNRSEYGFETDGRLKSDINPIGGGWQLIRNDNGNSREISMTSGEGRISRFKVENLPDGTRSQTHSAADGTRTVSDFKEAVTTTTLPNGTVTQSEEGPDPRFGMQAPLPKKTTLSVPSGLLSTITLTRNATLANLSDKLSLTQQTDTLTTNGKTSTSVYDATNKTITNTSAQGRTGNMLLNDKGRPIENQITGLNPVNTQYDSRGRTKSITSGSGADLRETLYGYYETGQMKGYLETVTNAQGQTSSFEYDLSGRITQQTLLDARIINYEYDANGNLTRLIPDGRPSHNFDYDGLDQKTSYLPPDIFGIANPVTTYSYNKDRQLSQITRPDGNTITPAYNQITGKLESLITALGQTDYAYHANSGKLNKIITADNQQLDYSYDGFLPKTSEWTGDINGIINQNYNNDFNLISRSINGKHNIAYRYDNDQLLTQAGDLVLGHEAQKGGLLKSTTLGLQTTAQSYTAFAELKNSSASYNGTTQISQNYIYDKLSRIKTKTETLGGISNTHEYSYDLSGRLKSVKKNNTIIETYGYDSNNNRTHKNGTQIAGYDDQDRLLTYNSNSYSYTDNGELKSKTGNGATTHYSYDTLGNLRQVTLPGDITIDYLIDGQNRRIGKKVNNQLKQGFLYKDQLNPIAELNENNEIVTRFVYAEKSHVPSYLIKIDPATLAEATYRVITDHLGSVRLVINVTDGNIAQRIDYDTWGRVIHDSNPGFQPFGFAGGIYDLHTQLVRFGARDYDAETGRWTAKDPIRFAGGDSNLYGYVLGDPVNWIDPFGLESSYFERIITGEIARENIQRYDNLLERLKDNDPSAINDLIEMACPVGVIKKKPGSFGKFKGTDALRRENKIARDAAKAEGLGKDQRNILHDAISGEGLNFQQIREIAKQIKQGIF